MLWSVSLISCVLPPSQLFLNKVSTYFSMKIVFKILAFASKTFFFNAADISPDLYFMYKYIWA